MAFIIKTLAMGCVCGKDTITVQNRKYNVRSRLGEGGFSVIDLIEDQHSHKLYALKRITCHSSEDEKNAMREVELMNSVHDRNLVPCEGHCVVPITGHMTAISELVIVMPFYKKGSVHDELVTLKHRSQHMTEARILHIMSGLCDAILALHTTNPPLAHRDIKPHNVMLAIGDDDVVDIPVLMDFGSMGAARIDIKGISEARALQDYAAEHCSMPYRAPELFNVDSHCRVDERVDIWSLGCTLYAMCFYESPFDAVYQRGDSVALAVMSGKVSIPDHKTTVYSVRLLDLLQSMLTVDPLTRPTINSVINQLKLLSVEDNNCV